MNYVLRFQFFPAFALAWFSPQVSGGVMIFVRGGFIICSYCGSYSGSVPVLSFNGNNSTWSKLIYASTTSR
jgi:hypothetical protein